MAKQTRNRTSKPSWQWSGATSLTWRAESSNVVWAQQDSRYKELVTVLTNERLRAFMSCNPPITENRALGRLEGYQLALDVLAELATMATPVKRAEEEPTYPIDNNDVAIAFVD